MSVANSPFASVTTKQIDMYVNYELKGLPKGSYFTNGSVQCQSFQTVAELKERIHRDVSGINTETLFHLGVPDVNDPRGLNIFFEGRTLDDSKTLAFYHIDNASTVEVSATKSSKTFFVDLLVFFVYIGLNMAINLYNKWMFRYINLASILFLPLFCLATCIVPCVTLILHSLCVLDSVLKFEVPLANLAVHQMAGFVVLGTFAFFASFCKIPCCEKCGLNGFMGCSKKEDCRGWAIVTALGVVGAFNFGMTSYALMLLSQADLQV